MMAHGARRAGALTALAVGALAMFAGFAGQAAAQPARTLTQVERDRAAQAARAERLRGQADATRAEIAALDARLLESAARRAEAEAAAADAEARLLALRQRMQADAARLAHNRDAFEASLITAAFAQRRVEHTATRVGIFARAAAPAMRAEMRQRSRDIDEARALDAHIGEEQINLAAAKTAIDAERTQLASLLARRRAVAASLTADASAAERRVRVLAAEARTLRELAQRVQRASVRRPASPSSGPSAVPAGWLAPATGTIVRAYGERAAGGPASQGVALRTRAGAQIVAPAAAEVAYAGEFRSYGQVLILNMEGGYTLVLTGLSSANRRVGERVQAGQAIGEMPAGTASDMQPPELYVEVRRDGQPIDPGRWLAGRSARTDASARGSG